MIHDLIVNAELTSAELKKISKRLAMTGGYELSLQEGLSAEEIETIALRFLSELEGESTRDSRYRSGNSYRILALLVENTDLSEPLRLRITQVLSA